MTDGRRIEVSTRTTEEQKREEIEAALARKRYEMAAALEEAIASRREYDSVWHATYARHQNSVILAHLPTDAQAAVIDVGCGVGILLEELVTRYTRVYGLDISPESLALIEIPSSSLRGLVVGDGEHLPYRSAAFDAVVLRGALHHIPDVDQALREFRRVLKPGGTLLMVEPCGDHALIRWGRGCLSKHKERYFQSEEMMGYLQQNGFRVLTLQRCAYVGFALTYLFRGPLSKLKRPAWIYRMCVNIFTLLDAALPFVPVIRRFNLGIIAVSRSSEDSHG